MISQPLILHLLNYVRALFPRHLMEPPHQSLIRRRDETARVDLLFDVRGILVVGCSRHSGLDQPRLENCITAKSRGTLSDLFEAQRAENMIGNIAYCREARTGIRTHPPDLLRAL